MRLVGQLKGKSILLAARFHYDASRAVLTAGRLS
jgi:hypothetical protein